MDITIDVNDYKLNVIAACVIKHNNKILVHKNINSNHYCLIGGRVKIGEDSETTIKREVEEEIGKQIEITGYIATIENFFEMKGSKYHEYMFVYQAEFKEAEDKKIEEESVSNGELIVSNKFSKVSGHLKSLEDKYGIINSAYLLTGFNDVNNFELRSISYDKEKGKWSI